jgi:hypothetical protein
MDRRTLLKGSALSLPMLFITKFAMASTATVSGFDTTSIAAAQTSAGPGGTVIFPAGTYIVDGLTASVADQTWLLDRYAIIKKADTTGPLTPILLLSANGIRIRGGTLDGNRAVSPGTPDGVDSVGFSLDCEDMILQNVAGWGLAINDAPLNLRRCTFRNNVLSDVIWHLNGSAVGQAPNIDQCIFDKSMFAANVLTTGCLLIGSMNQNNVQYALNPRVTRCQLLMPWNTTNNVGSEIRNCQRGWISDNVCIGGGTGFSNAQSGFMVYRDNVFQGQTTYGIEGGGNDTLYIGNHGTGYGPSRWGIFLNPITTSSMVTDNHFVGYTDAPIQNAAPSGGNTVVNNW